MKKSILLITLLIAILSCSKYNDNDIIMTFKGGIIKWKDVKFQAEEFKRMHPDIKENIGQFKDIVIETNVIPKIMSIEAKNSHKHHTLLKKRMQLIKEECMINVLQKKINDQVIFKDNVYKIFYVGITKSDFNNNLSPDDISNKAIEILDKIKNVKDNRKYKSILEDFADNTDYNIKWGIRDYFILEDATPSIAAVVSTLKNNQYYGQPVKIEDESYLLIYLLNKKTVTNKNIHRIIKDRTTAKNVLNNKRLNALHNYIRELENYTIIKKHYENFSKNDKDLMLLEIQPNVKINVDDFEYRFAQTLISDKIKRNYNFKFSIPTNISQQERIYHLDNIILKKMLLYNDAVENELYENEHFINLFEQSIDDLFVNVFRFDISKIDFKPTEADIEQYYKKNKIDQQSEKEKKMIMYKLYLQNHAKYMEEWKKQKTEEYEVNFVEDDVTLLKRLLRSKARSSL